MRSIVIRGLLTLLVMWFTPGLWGKLAVGTAGVCLIVLYMTRKLVITAEQYRTAFYDKVSRTVVISC